MTGALSPTHWVIILVVVLLLFGAKRLPDAARGLGKSMRIFKAETAALTAETSRGPDDASTGDTTDGAGALETSTAPTTATAPTTPTTATAPTTARGAVGSTGPAPAPQPAPQPAASGSAA